ncbi:MAG: glycoside hydrolase family 31 protein [Polyangiaceae bacterium]|nr:glycoside hydrolase family 31 protein [Polyangiaceae bacterium]
MSQRSFALGVMGAIWAVALVGCGSDEPASDSPRDPELDSGDLSITFTGDELELSDGGTRLLRLPKDAFQWGMVSALEDFNYDPYRFYVPHALYAPADTTWISPEEMRVSAQDENSLTLELSYPEGKRGSLVIEAPAPGRFSALWKPEDPGSPIAFFRLRPRGNAEEGFYGLGEYFDDVNHRGKVRPMQIEVDASIESGYYEAHVPVPFLTGTSGWGLYVESDRPGAFAVAADAAEPDLVEAAFGTGFGSAEGLRFHLFGARHPLDVTKFYYDVTGYPSVPARWALGPWVWRDENKDQAEFLADAQTIRDLDLATSGMWIDRPYATAVNTFDFLPSQFPDAQAMIDEAHALGFRMALWHTPYLDEKDGAAETAALRAEADAGGYYPVKSGLLLNKWGRPIDFTNPDAYAWWQQQIGKYKAMGIEGYKLDYAEDIVPGLTNARNEWVFADGSDERTMHAGYQRFYHRVYAETLPEDGGFLICRGGTAGDQVNVNVIWPGDLDATFHKHAEPFDDNGTTVRGVGGLPASIVAGLSLGASGFPFFASDTGGYKHSPPDKELFTRWFEQTAFSPVMQIGTSTNSVAWDPNGGPGFDQEMLDWYRVYTRIHLRLFPYLWTYAQDLKVSGRPIARPLGLAYPELARHPNDIYILGDSILVAPVVDRDARSREVIFPAGRWVNWWTGAVQEGGTTVSVDAPLGQIPVYVREGGVVPMLRPTIDTMAPTTLPAEVDSYATTPGVLYARVVAGEATTFAVFDGAELGVAEQDDGAVELTTSDGAEFKLGTLFELIAFGAVPSGVVADGSALAALSSLEELESSASGWFFDSAVGGTLHVKLAPGSHRVQISR